MELKSVFFLLLCVMVALLLRDKPMAERFQDRNTMQKVQMKNTV